MMDNSDDLLVEEWETVADVAEMATDSGLRDCKSS